MSIAVRCVNVSVSVIVSEIVLETVRVYASRVTVPSMDSVKGIVWEVRWTVVVPSMDSVAVRDSMKVVVAICVSDMLLELDGGECDGERVLDLLPLSMISFSSV